ncbi:PHOG protein [Plectosphaerella cucumerina]|uniref:PHOG protein n=1 Tax=Plectosphaerella cucumerina TaxID=40658 RepID=A0A8K0X745_9PEZI|nr:PHOG protein [Plectosphaerella cucumerina]
MDAYNTMPSMSSAPSVDGIDLGGGVDGLPHSLFDEALIDNVGASYPGLAFPTTYDFQDFSAGFDDPFSMTTRQYEMPAPVDDLNTESPSQELDNKLLGFGVPMAKAALLDESGRPVDLSLVTAELRGMFFVAEDVFGGDNPGRPLELTCYRRNLWQCLGEITLPRHITQVIDAQGNQMPVYELAASIGASESIDGKPTEIISIPWKSANAAPGEEFKASGAPANIPLDLESGQEVDMNRVTLGMAWKRLQFKHATANNGRRKGLQQHYIVHINLLVRGQTGEWIPVVEIQSSPVIVRGRSPRNFDSKKDVPVSGEKKSDKRASSEVSQAPKEENGLSGHGQGLNPMGTLQHSTSWPTPQPYREHTPNLPAAKRVAMSPGIPRPPVPSWSSETGRSQRPSAGSHAPRSMVSGPINLSLSEDERSPNRSSSELHSPRFSKTTTMPDPNLSQSPKDDEEMLYEYFPLSVDDWMPPVDAVYRPHVVHHTSMPSEIKAQQLKSKMKRYFTAET